MTAYYNEIEPYAADWLENLIRGGHIAPGDVDRRSIVDVKPDDLKGYAQCHFFAGIGGWSYALRLAGWPDDRPVWTGSCPCQPFSAAGKQKGIADRRHLWPAWFRLIAECRPSIIFGEQVDAAVRQGWLDLVFSDLEATGYACGTAVLPACSVGAPHIRKRLWFVADANQQPGERRTRAISGTQTAVGGAGTFNGYLADGFADGCEASELADADGGNASAERLQRSGQQRQQPEDGRALLLADTQSDRRIEGESISGGRGERVNAQRQAGRITEHRDVSELGDLDKPRSQGRCLDAEEHADQWPVGTAGKSGELDNAESGRDFGSNKPAGIFQQLIGRSAWDHPDWLPCTDGKARPVEPGTFPLAHGIPGRMGRLRAYGNAIVPQVAAEFIRASCGS